MRATARTGDALVWSEVPVLRDTIVKRSVKEQVSDKIATLIASGILQVGDPLPGERELAAALNVSRETIRGATQVLAARGILEISHGSRTRVLRADVGPVTVGFATARAIDAYDIESVHAARLLVEREIVAAAAPRMTAAGLQALDASLAAQAAALDDSVRFLIADREFHIAIYQAGGNRLLADFATDLYAYMMDYRRTAVARRGAIAQSVADHRAITEALRRRDAEAAVAAYAHHTERIYETTRSVLAPSSAQRS